MSNNELLEKVISTSSIGAGTVANGGLYGGYLDGAQSARFIDYLWDATVLGGQVRKIRMNADSVELDRMAVGERLLRMATEAVNDGVGVAVAFTKVSLSTEKFRLDWELSSEALEDGLEGEALEDHIARLMANQIAQDLEDLAINGDSLGKSTDPLLAGFDGWRKRLYGGGQVVDAAGANLDKGLFNRAVRAMPRQFMSGRGSLKWFTVSGLLQDYVYSSTQLISDVYLQNPQAATVDGTTPDSPGPNAGWSPAAPFGIRAQEVPLFPEYAITGGKHGSDVWLVDPSNLIWGVKREIQVFRDFVPKKDSIEYTLYTRVGCTVENPQASVVVKNVAYVD